MVAESAGRRESLKDALRSSLGEIPNVENFEQFKTSQFAIAITNAPLDRGLLITDQLTVISENQLYEHRVVQRRRKRQQEVSEEFLIRSLTELSIGAPVVHIDHGVGRYAGLITLAIEGQDYEFLQLDYAEDAKVYVPVTNLHLISRYSGGDPDLAPLHKIGTDAWSKAKRKALEQIHDVAAELLHIQARRQSKPGFAFELISRFICNLQVALRMKKHLIRPMQLKLRCMICSKQNQWIDWYVVMWVLVKPKWPCEQHLLQYKMVNKLQF